MCQKKIGKVQSRHVKLTIGKVQPRHVNRFPIVCLIEEIQNKFSQFFFPKS